MSKFLFVAGNMAAFDMSLPEAVVSPGIRPLLCKHYILVYFGGLMHVIVFFAHLWSNVSWCTGVTNFEIVFCNDCRLI